MSGAKSIYVCSVCAGSGYYMPDLICPLCESDPNFFIDSPNCSDDEQSLTSENCKSPTTTDSNKIEFDDSEVKMENENTKSNMAKQSTYGGLMKGFLLR